MENWKEFRFKIEGEIGGVTITPYTMPLSRLAVYLVDLAQLLGHSESVHLIQVAEGSAAPVFLVDPAEEARVIHQVRNAQKGMGPRNANRAYRKLDTLLRQDNATGRIVDQAKQENVIEFPGNKANLPETYTNIRERATVTGRLKRVGGFDQTIPIHLLQRDGAILYCEANESIAEQIAHFYSKVIRIHGIATYSRGTEGKWKMENFRIQSFDDTPLIDESFTETMEKLRAIEGNEWAEVADPLEELRKIAGSLNSTGEQIGIPTPAMAEVLVRAGKGRAQFVAVLSDRMRFQIVPFDARGAIEAAELIARVKTNAETWGTHAKVKFDIQIVATAKAEDATVIYSDDQDIENFAKRLKIPVVRICDLPLPPPENPSDIQTVPVGEQRPLFDMTPPLFRSADQFGSPGQEEGIKHGPAILETRPGRKIVLEDEAENTPSDSTSVRGSDGGRA